MSNSMPTQFPNTMNTPETTIHLAEIKRLQYEVRELSEQRDILRVRLDNALASLSELCKQTHDAEQFLAHVETPEPPIGPSERCAALVALTACLSLAAIAVWMLSRGHQAQGFGMLLFATAIAIVLWPAKERE